MKNRNWTLGFLLCLTMLGGAAMAIVTRHGAGIESDSVMYICASRSLAAGCGYVVNGAALTLFPPLYSFVLSLFIRCGFTLYEGMRLLQVVLFMCNVFLAGFIIFEVTDSMFAALLCSLIIGSAQDMLLYHSFCLSEGLFVFLTQLVLIATIRFLDSGKFRFLVLSSIFISLATLTRYVGWAWIFGNIAVLFFIQKAPNRRSVSIIASGGISVLPIFIWTLRNRHYGHVMGRALDFHNFVDEETMQSVLRTLSLWSSQGALQRPTLILFISLFLSFSLLFVVWKLKPDDRVRPVLSVIVLYALSYVLFLIASATFFEADLFQDSERILLPLHLLIILSICISIPHVFRYFRRRGWSAILWGLACLVLPLHLARGCEWLNSVRGDGQGYAGTRYRDSMLLTRVNGLPSGTDIFTNHDSPIIFYANRFPSFVPLLIDNRTGRPNPSYSQEMKTMAQRIKAGAVLVYFDIGDDWYSYPAITDVQQFIPLKCIDREPDGAIWVAQTPKLQ